MILKKTRGKFDLKKKSQHESGDSTTVAICRHGTLTQSNVAPVFSNLIQFVLECHTDDTVVIQSTSSDYAYINLRQMGFDGFVHDVIVQRDALHNIFALWILTQRFGCYFKKIVDGLQFPSLYSFRIIIERCNDRVRTTLIHDVEYGTEGDASCEEDLLFYYFSLLTNQIFAFRRGG